MYLKATTRLYTLAFITLCVPAYAAVPDIESANNQIDAQILYKYINHTEDVNAVVLDTEDGHIAGYGLTGSIMKDLWLGHDYLALTYSSSAGKTHYKGGTLENPAYGFLEGISRARIRDFNFRYGKGYTLDDSSMVTLYGELGHHKYKRDVMNGAPGGYLEIYAHDYYGIGALGQYSSMDKLVFSAYSLLGRTFKANIVVTPAFGFSARLGNSTLYKIGASIDYAFTKNMHANLITEITSWNYGASASQPIGNGLYAYEPDSMTNDTTTKIGIGYAF